jgi:hypothetical protein
MAQPKKTVDGAKLIPDIVQAALGTKTFTQASRPISQQERDSLSRAIRMDVDQWRLQFTAKLRETGSALLDDLLRRKDQLKAGELAYSLAVCVDKASILDGRSQLNASSVNIQVNNFGNASKSSLLDQLSGQLTPLPVAVVESFQTTPKISGEPINVS